MVAPSGQYLEAVGSADQMPPEQLLALAIESFAMVSNVQCDVCWYCESRAHVNGMVGHACVVWAGTDFAWHCVLAKFCVRVSACIGDA